MKDSKNTKKIFNFKYLLLFLTIGLFIASCSDEKTISSPSIFLKTGYQYTQNEDKIPIGGKIILGIIAYGNGEKITYLNIKRKTDASVINEIDKGVYCDNLDTVFTFSKSEADNEIWTVVIQTSNRDTVSTSIKILKGAGTAFTEITYYPSIILGYQNNHENNHFLDLETGNTYDETNVIGHESEIDILSFFYVTSGNNSPTMSCPNYPTIPGYFPIISSWSVKNTTVYDYYTSDFNLITVEQFDECANDSLLVNGFKPEKVSALCKYCYTGRVIPFKSQSGKYGLIKVINAQESEDGKTEIAIKIQK